MAHNATNGGLTVTGIVQNSETRTNTWLWRIDKDPLAAVCVVVRTTAESLPELSASHNFR